MTENERKLELAQREADFRELLGSARGRRFLWRLLNHDTRCFSSTYTGEPLSSAHNEGRRAVGLELMQEAQALDPAAYSLMVTERMADLAARRAKPKKVKSPED